MHSYKGHPESYRRARKPNMLKGVSGCHKAKSYKTSSYTLVFKNNSQCSFSILDICLSYFLPCWSQGFRQPRVQLRDKIHYFGLPNSKDVLRTDKSISPQFLLGICSFNFPPGLIEQLYQHTVKETRTVNPDSGLLAHDDATASPWLLGSRSEFPLESLQHQESGAETGAHHAGKHAVPQRGPTREGTVNTQDKDEAWQLHRLGPDYSGRNK